MSDATLFQIKPIVGVSQKRPTISLLNKSGSGIFTFRSRWCYCAKIITALAVVFLLVLFVFRLPAARGPGRDPLRQARQHALLLRLLLRRLVLLRRRRLTMSALHSFSLAARFIRAPPPGGA